MLKINYIVGCGFGKQPLRNASGELGQHIKFPLYVLVNDDDEFVGYLMGSYRHSISEVDSGRRRRIRIQTTLP